MGRSSRGEREAKNWEKMSSACSENQGPPEIGSHPYPVSCHARVPGRQRP